VIFVSLAFLAIAAVLLIVAIAKSSIAFGVAALVLSVLAGLLLIVAWTVYRQALAAGKRDEGLEPWAPSAVPRAASTAAPAPAVPTPSLASQNGAPVGGYDDLSTTEAARIAETLNLDELHALRRYEVEHAFRDPVVAAIDKRIKEIVMIRRQIHSGDPANA
jgi:hypothetical protein